METAANGSNGELEPATDRPPIVVAKYGGSSLATPAHINAVADLLAAEQDDGDRRVVVVSAMGDTTDHLLALAA